MANFDIWKILGVITAILLIAFWRGRNAVWGGLTIGVVVGLIIVIFFAFKGSGFDWFIIGKSAILGALLGFMAELLGKVSDLIKKSR